MPDSVFRGGMAMASERGAFYCSRFKYDPENLGPAFIAITCYWEPHARSARSPVRCLMEESLAGNAIPSMFSISPVARRLEIPSAIPPATHASFSDRMSSTSSTPYESGRGCSRSVRIKFKRDTSSLERGTQPGRPPGSTIAHQLSLS